VQGLLAFEARAERRERAFKRGIVTATGLAILGLLAGTSAGRYRTRVLASGGREALAGLVGLPADRRLVEARRREKRIRDADSARRGLAEVAAPGSGMDVFLRAAGMDAGSAVVRWGNDDRSIVLSSAVFEPDDDRSYRLKPGVRSVWVIGLGFSKSLGLFLIPDTPEARGAAGRAGGRVVPASVQTTNSWGCRGPEPDPGAPVRVLVLGDSMMQGALVGDTETPPARLQARLASALGAPVSVLNTGHIGYSPEQYYHTLRAFGDRFRPQYVIISITNNDFGDLSLENWAEGGYWLEQIVDLCNFRGWSFLLVPAPEELTLLGPRALGRFQGRLDQIFKRGGMHYVDPLEPFTDEVIRLKNARRRRGDPDVFNPLYNLHLLGDRHFSPIGSDLWARVVARRLLLAWDTQVLIGLPAPEPVTRHARSETPDDPPPG
jgi:hypothetical protein